jgi:uncharacterized membrane protein
VVDPPRVELAKVEDDLVPGPSGGIPVRWYRAQTPPPATTDTDRRSFRMVLLRRLKGYPGHPSHPPLTDASIGAYTVAVALLVLGALGLEEPAMAHGALLAISAGLVLAPPTMLTGLLDWRELPSGTPKRKLANLHLGIMLAATAAFALSWFPAQAGYQDGRVHAGALVLALAGEALLFAGGYLGGALVYVHGHRVLAQPQAPVGEALLPGRLGPRSHTLESPIGSRPPAPPRDRH